MTKREDEFDNVLVPGMKYVMSPGFKADQLDGSSEVERASQKNFIGRIVAGVLDAGIQQYNEKGEKTVIVSLRSFVSWYAAGLNVLYTSVLRVEAAVAGVVVQIGALSKALNGLDAEELERRHTEAAEKALAKSFGRYELRRVESGAADEQKAIEAARVEPVVAEPEGEKEATA